jgi:hypothetical protein
MIEERLNRCGYSLLNWVDRSRGDFKCPFFLFRFQKIFDHLFLKCEDLPEKSRVHDPRRIFLASNQIRDNVPVVEDSLIL